LKAAVNDIQGYKNDMAKIEQKLKAGRTFCFSFSTFNSETALFGLHSKDLCYAAGKFAGTNFFRLLPF